MVTADFTATEARGTAAVNSWQVEKVAPEDDYLMGVSMAAFEPTGPSYWSASHAGAPVPQENAEDQQMRILGKELLLDSGADTGRGGVVERIILPALRLDQESRAWAAGDMRRIAIGIEGIVRNLAQSTPANGLSLTARVRRFQEEGNPELKFTVYTQMNPEQAMAFWDAIELRVEEWRDRLPPRVRVILDESVAISVEWVE